MRLSPSSGVRVQGAILGIAAENLFPETSRITSVPSGNSSPFSISCVSTKPGASSESTKLIVGKIWSNLKKETFKSCINDIKSGLKKIDNLSIKDYIEKCLSLKHSNRYNINHITDNFNHLLKKLI